jgi:hypothetical protein
MTPLNYRDVNVYYLYSEDRKLNFLKDKIIMVAFYLCINMLYLAKKKVLKHSWLFYL